MTDHASALDVSFTVPVDGYVGVARLVTGGVASRIGLEFDAADDLQLAVETVLRTLPFAEERATITLCVEDDELVATVGPLAADAAEWHLRSAASDRINLEELLERLVDDADWRPGEMATLVLRKSLHVD